MTIIEQLTFLANVYTQYAAEFTNNTHFTANNGNNIITVYYSYDGNINSNSLDYDFDYTYRAYSVYNNDDYIGAIIVYDEGQIAFEPSTY